METFIGFCAILAISLIGPKGLVVLATRALH